MQAREEKYIYEWETKRGKGKWSYILLTAIVWGSIVPVLIKAFKLAFRGQLSFANLKAAIFQKAFLSTWLTFMGFFFLFAMLMWHLAKQKYLEFKQKQQSQKDLGLRDEHSFD